MRPFVAPADQAFALYDSAAQTLLPLTLPKGEALSFYACGITPYAAPHVGHLRSFVVFDALARTLEAFGWPTTLVRNITDVDDKIVAMAADQGTDWKTLSWGWAAHNRAQFAKVGVRPTPEPKVSEHIGDILALIERLVTRGHAYATATGDVYFALDTFEGTDVAHQPRESLLTAQGNSRVATDGKRNPGDFALWKAAKPGEPVWPSPWGDGRPGWHIECSAMAEAFFGRTLTIHGGGTDLRFPHHQCEVCQSEAALGRPLAQHWIHHGSVLHEGEKMSKSLGNTVTAAEALTQAEALLPGAGGAVVRWALLGTHWTKPLDWTSNLLPRVADDLRRLGEALQGAMRARGVADWAGLLAHDDQGQAEAFPAEGPFWSALATNFNVPLALASVRQAAKAAGLKGPLGWTAAVFLGRALHLLGMEEVLWPIAWQMSSATPQQVPDEVRQLVELRESARMARDFVQADALRARILALGWMVMDRPQGPELTALDVSLAG